MTKKNQVLVEKEEKLNNETKDNNQNNTKTGESKNEKDNTKNQDNKEKNTDKAESTNSHKNDNANWKENFMQNPDMLTYRNGKAEILDYGIFDDNGDYQTTLNNNQEYTV